MNILAFDIGGTAIKYAYIDKEANILEKGKVSTPRGSKESLFEELKKIYLNRKIEVEGIAISMPGTIDSKTGFIYQGGALTYNAGTYFAKELSDIIKLPVVIGNDAKCAALAEVWKGNLSDVNDGIVIVLGTGVGGALVKDKKVHYGKNFFSGELSFTLVNDFANKGEKTALGAAGSIPGLVKRIGRVLGNEEMDGVEVFEFINSGNEKALKIFNDYCQMLALQIYNYQAIFDPEAICIGGGVSTQKILIETLRNILNGIYANIPVVMPKVDLRLCKFNNDSNLIGAVYNYLTIN